jgi:putative component of membrane protein insertase Oxa1/YidC/SpoIIIJ protein YidD
MVMSVPLFGLRYDAASVAARWAIDFYKVNLSPLQGGQVCNFSPTCSQFSKQAIDRYGLPSGVLMTADRLERCNPFAWSYLGSYYAGASQGRIADPIENHWLALASGSVAAQGKVQPEGRIKNFIPHDSDFCENRDATVFAAKTGGVPIFTKSGSDTNLPDQLAFADYLFSQGDYNRAISEYRRFQVEDSDPVKLAYAQFQIGESHYRNGDFKDAETSFRDALSLSNYQLARYSLARVLLAEKRYPAARHYLATIRDSALLKPARAIQALSYYRQYDFPSGAKVTATLAARSLDDDSLTCRLRAVQSRRIPERSRCAGSVMSAVIPGLGHAYSGRIGDGLYSFLAVAVLGAASYYYWENHAEQDPTYLKFGIVAGLGVIFHLGNIYGANVAARDYNLLQQRNRLNEVETILGPIVLQPDYRQLVRR